MDEDTNAAPLDEEYGPIERAFRETFNETHANDEYSSHSQYRIVFEHLIPKILIGIINWAYIYSGGNIEKTFYWRAAFEISKFVARWILTPAIIIAVYYVGYHEIAKWTAIPYGIYVIIHAAFFPRRYLRRKALTKELEEYESKLKALIGVYQSSSPEIFNPSRLRDLIARAESDEVLLRPAVYSILDRAIDRDPAVFAIEGSG